MVIGVDLGGTNVRGAIVAPDGSLSRRIERPSFAREGEVVCLTALRNLILEVSNGERPSAVGIAIPGHIDSVAGIVLWAPNFGEVVDGRLRIWEDVDIFGPLDAIGAKIIIGNDANLAALGEYRFGVGRGANGFVLYTLGTGVGTGVIVAPNCVQGELRSPAVYIGHRGGASEMGHVKVVSNGRLCGCGSQGCLETYCGTEGLLQTARECRIEVQSPKALYDEAKNGNSAAIAAWKEFGAQLGVAVGNTINAWAPEVIAIGGQVAGAWEFFAPALESAARANSIGSLAANARIVRASESDDAGILGAGAIAHEAL